MKSRRARWDGRMVDDDFFLGVLHPKQKVFSREVVRSGDFDGRPAGGDEGGGGLSSPPGPAHALGGRRLKGRRGSIEPRRWGLGRLGPWYMAAENWVSFPFMNEFCSCGGCWLEIIS